MKLNQPLLAVCLCVLVIGSTAVNAEDASRDARGLIAFYDFAERSGAVVKDRTGNGLHLKIEKLDGVRRSAGKLQIVGDTQIVSDKPPKKLMREIRNSRELTIEAWIKPANDKQNGPARIVSLSRNSTNRNFTLGQEGNRYNVRFRSKNADSNGLPATEAPKKSVKLKTTHVVYTRNRDGKARIYVNGKQIADRDIRGDLSNWDNACRLTLANEVGGGRLWKGTYYLVAVYKRSLSKSDVERNFRAGPGAGSDAPTKIARRDPAELHFEHKVAPLLARHCLECHDPGTHKGGLVLSEKKQAFAGGESGDAIVAGKSDDSLVWISVESDDMPHDRPPLSSDEKKILKEWIDSGAKWSLDKLDAAIYANLGSGSQNFVRRLTVDEYIDTVRATVGIDISAEARELLPTDLRADGFTNTAYNLNVDLRHVEAYAKLAEVIVKRMDVPKFADRFGKKRDFTDNNMRPLIGRIGKALYRGPLDDDEINTLRGITTTVAAASGNVDEAVGFAIEAMLQSPRFIYRVENQRGGEDGWFVDSYELASRLSYLLWGGPPDAELLEAAEEGDLGPDACRKHVERMLNDPRAVAHSKRFIADWLNLNRLSNLSPNAERFPTWDKSLASDMRNETLAFFEQIVWTEGRPLGDLLNAQVTFATPRLAKHYGLKPITAEVIREQGFTPIYEPNSKAANEESNADRLVAYDVSAHPARGGLLTQGSVLTVGGDDASTVTRGLFVMHELLRGVVKDPPPGVDTTPKPTKEGLTKRAIAMTRIENESCGGCHSRFEPLSFGLEKFDGIGAYKEQDEHGNEQEDFGEVLFPGAAEPIQYKTAGELMDVLAKSERVQESMTWKVTQFAIGRPLAVGDARTMTKINEETSKNGGTYQSLMMAIAMSDLIQMTKGDGEE